jgi:hypothetical protein
MRKKVGQREHVNPTLDEALQVLRIFTLGGPLAKTIRFDTYCNECNTKISIYLSEDSQTGEVWFEGPEKCPCCNVVISDATPYEMSQKEIFRYFGEY